MKKVSKLSDHIWPVTNWKIVTCKYVKEVITQKFEKGKKPAQSNKHSGKIMRVKAKTMQPVPWNFLVRDGVLILSISS